MGESYIKCVNQYNGQGVSKLWKFRRQWFAIECQLHKVHGDGKYINYQ
jgi:hypothetical protein